MECWGAQGGNEPSSDGGRGAYTVGITSINLPVSFYIYISVDKEKEGAKEIEALKRADGMVEVQQELHLVEVVQLMLEQQMDLGIISTV